MKNYRQGIKKTPKAPWAISVLKEDIQAFELLVEKAVSQKKEPDYT